MLPLAPTPVAQEALGWPAPGLETGTLDAADELTDLDPREVEDAPTMIRRSPLPPPLREAVSPAIAAAAAAAVVAAANESHTVRDPEPRPSSSRGFAASLSGKVGKYELRTKLGRGAFGVVFLARDPSLDRDVAIKILRPTHLTNQEIVQRFLQEARATARISHPGIVTIHDCGRVETSAGVTAFIAMELLAGESLTARLSRTVRFEPAAAAEIVRQVASALEAAHRADVLHRDLKPDNIYLVPDPAMPEGERIKVLDFGLAKIGQDGHTQTQIVFGTPRYMSPEQCRSAAGVDHRSDIYALGCILYELVTGRPPFDGDVRQLIERHQRMTAPRASAIVPGLTPALDDLIAEMLAKDPMRRPQTMGAVQRALAGASVEPVPPALLSVPMPAVPGPATVAMSAALAAAIAGPAPGPISGPATGSLTGPLAAGFAAGTDPRLSRPLELRRPAPHPLPRPSGLAIPLVPGRVACPAPQPTGALGSAPHSQPPPADLLPVAPYASAALPVAPYASAALPVAPYASASLPAAPRARPHSAPGVPLGVSVEISVPLAVPGVSAALAALDGGPASGVVLVPASAAPGGRAASAVYPLAPSAWRRLLVVILCLAIMATGAGIAWLIMT